MALQTMESRDNVVAGEWRAALERLKACVNASPQIEVSGRSLSVPPGARDEFYRLFDAVRYAYVESTRDLLPDGLERLSVSYGGTEAALLARTGLRSIVLPTSLRGLFDDPIGACAHAIYEPLMRLLQGRVDVEEFGREAEAALVPYAHGIFQCGYQVWLAYSLVLMLKPVRIWRVEFNEDCIPVAAATDVIELGRQVAFPERRIPEIVVDTANGCRYSIKLECVSDVALYDMPIRKPRESILTGDSSGVTGDRVMIVHALHDGRIPVISNRVTGMVMPPDFVVEFPSCGSLSTTAGLCGLELRARVLAPKQGVYVLTNNKEALPDCASGEHPFRVITVGLEAEALRPVAERIAGCSLNTSKED